MATLNILGKASITYPMSLYRNFNRQINILLLRAVFDGPILPAESYPKKGD